MERNESPRDDSTKNKKRNSKKKKDSIAQPHDTFFKENMGKKEVITDFLQFYLPEEVSTYINYESIVAVEPKTISPKLKLGEADLLFQVEICEISLYLLVLMEHKSYTDRHTPIQILRYITEIWEKQLKENESIKPVLPIVFYQGAKKWEYPQLKDRLPKDMPTELLQFMPLYQALYYDFSLENKAEVKGSKLELLYYLQVIKTIYQKEKVVLKKETLEIFKVLGQLEQDMFLEYIEKTITYLSATRQDMADEEIIELVKQRGGDTMETIVDRLKKRGRIEGRQEGRQEGILIGERRGRSEGRLEGKLSIARKMRQDAFPMEMIIKYTDLTEEEILLL